jgi:hypothetical protein
MFTSGKYRSERRLSFSTLECPIFSGKALNVGLPSDRVTDGVNLESLEARDSFNIFKG